MVRNENQLCFGQIEYIIIIQQKLKQIIHKLFNKIAQVVFEEFQYMSTSNLSRNSVINYNQTTNQKTLIYDLRSELSNLKNQFSRLINKSGDQSSKSKVQQKLGSKSRYNQLGSEKDAQMDFTSASQSQISSKYSQIAPSYQFKRPENRNIPVYQKINNSIKKTGPMQQCSSPIQNLLSSRYQFVTKPNQTKRQDQNLSTIYIKRHQEATLTSKKSNVNLDQQFDKTSIASKLTNKDTEVSFSNQAALNQQLNAANERVKRLEQQNKSLVAKNNSSAQQICDLELRCSKLQKEFQQSQNKSYKKDESVKNLQQIVRQLSHKIGKASQVTAQIGKQKLRQVQTIKQNHYKDIINQQKEFQKILIAQKQNVSQKYQEILYHQRENYERKLGEAQNQKQHILQQIKAQKENADRFKVSLDEVEKQKFLAENQIKLKNIEITRQNEVIRVLSEKQTKMENQFKQKISGLERDLKQKQAKKQEEKKQVLSPVVFAPSTNLSQSQANKQLQDKLNLYLNNIDKQSQKIKDQKAELQKALRLVDEYNRIICEKQVVIRNLMKDCKILQKQSTENRKSKRELQIILQQSNQKIIILRGEKLQQKYK